MNINSTNLSKLIHIQNSHKTSEYFNQNKFILFTLSFLTKKGTVQKCLIDELSFKMEEIQEYMKLLKEENLLTSEDTETFNKAIKAKPSDKKDFKEQMTELLDHLNFLTNTKLTLTEDRKKIMMKLLASEKYSLSDIKYVNLYFTMIWGSDPAMKKYVRPETLYNQKFESRLEESKMFFDEIKKYEKDISKLCKTFYKLIELEIYPTRRLLASEVDIQQGSCSQLPVNLEKTIIHWLTSGYSIDDIINTIQVTIDTWSKKQEYAQHISISKILDMKFPERAAAVKRITANKNTERKLKDGVKFAQSWLERKQEEEEKNVK